jgi:hypothetical protein
VAAVAGKAGGMVATTDPTNSAPARGVGEAARLALGVPVALVFGVVALIRRARALHPVGVAFRATFTLDGPAAGSVPELGPPGTSRPGVVRLSRGGGFPEDWPDIHGIALELTPSSHAAGDGQSGREQDLLWSSAGRSRLGRRLLRPSRSFDGLWATSLTSFAAGGRTVVWAAEVLPAGAGGSGAPDGGPLTVEALQADPGRAPAIAVLVATSSGPWERVGTIVPGARLSPEEEEALAFSPWDNGDGIVPVGLLNQLRDAAYRASRRARHPRDA